MAVFMCLRCGPKLQTYPKMIIVVAPIPICSDLPGSVKCACVQRTWKRSCLKGKQRQRFGDMGLIELRKTNNFQPQSHF